MTTMQAQASFDRRVVLDDVKARLSAISDTLSDSRIDVGQLRRDVDELTAITGRIAWLADISTPRPLHIRGWADRHRFIGHRAAAEGS